MNPAWSVIFFTVLTGMGQGLFLMLVLAQAREAPGTPEPHSLAIGGGIAVVLMCAGLACSFFHLGHPLRAWRAVAMWRTSWLSREVIILPATIGLAGWWSFAHGFGWPGTGVLGPAGVVLCLALWGCTGMIYACLRFLREWAHWLTPVNFALLGWMSGASAFACYWFSVYGAEAARPAVEAALVLTLVAACGRIASLVRNHHLKPLSTPQSAIGVANAKLRQMSQGATGGSFNTREFFHGKSALVVRNVKWVTLGLAFMLPFVLLMIAARSPVMWLLGAAALSQLLGLLAERWLFFAQANHPQNIYYQAVA